jgi:predicted nucleic acid-binding protein
MPADVVTSIPNGVDLFLDANIFIYAFSGASGQCQDLLARCARQELYGITSCEVISETTHRLMVGEAFQKGLIHRPRAEDLRQQPAIVRLLTDYWSQVSQIFQMNLVVLSGRETTLRRAQLGRTAHGLLTLDSVLLATMEEYGVHHLASHDRDFDGIATLTVYHPTDFP